MHLQRVYKLRLSRNATRRRRGASVLEAAIVLPVLLLFLLSGLELGLMLIRKNALAEAARGGARAAIVRGSRCDAAMQMGPATVECTASDNNGVADACRRMLPTMNPAEVDIEVRWPSASNEAGELVTVNVSYEHRFTTPFMDHLLPAQLQSESTMSIAR